MGMDLWEMASKVDATVDRMFTALASTDTERIQHELNGLRRLCAVARENSGSYCDPSPGNTSKPKIEDVRVRDVLLREGSVDEFWRVLRVRRRKHQVDVVDQEGRQRIYNVCEFRCRWGQEEASRLNLSWRY